MLKKFSRKTNFILIGIVVGIFVGVSIKHVLGDTTNVPGTVRADNLTINTSGQYTNGLIVANGNLLVPNGKVGIGTTDPTEALTITGKIQATGFCIGTSCITDWNDLKAILGGGTTNPLSDTVSKTSNSPDGPWINNNELCNPGTVYERITGVNKNSNPPLKGCASPTASSDCLSATNHRLFTPEEWANDTTVETHLAVNKTYYPMGKYDFYVSSGSTVKNVGSVTLKNCQSQTRYQWACVVVSPSPGPDTSSYACGAGNVDEAHSFDGISCTCRAY